MTIARASFSGLHLVQSEREMEAARLVKSDEELKPVWLYPELLEGNPPERWGHSACYSDGKLYIYGGCCGGLHFSDVVLLDLRTMSWKTLSTTGCEPGISDSHSAVLHDGKMVIFGGTNGTRKTSDVHILDLNTLVWAHPAVQGAAPSPRESHTATLINSSQILVFGGSGEGEANYVNDVHILDLERMKWILPDVKGTSPASRDSHTAVLMGNQLVVYGGDCGDRYLSEVDLLELDTLTWSKLRIAGSTQPGARAGHAAVVVDTKMFVFGGVGDRTYYSDLWVLHLGNGTWSQLDVGNVHPQGRFSHVALLAEKNNILVYGGCGEDERPLNEFLVLCLNTEHEARAVWKFLGNQYDLQSLQRRKAGARESRSNKAPPKLSGDKNIIPKECSPMKPAKLIDSERKGRGANDQIKRRRTEYYKEFRQNKDNQNSNSSLLVSPHSSTEAHALRLPTVQLQVRIPSHLRDFHNETVLTTTSVHRQEACAPVPIGAQVLGTVDGVFDSGYLMTAQLNGQIFRGVLFGPAHSAAPKPSSSRAAEVEKPFSVFLPQHPQADSNEASRKALKDEDVVLSL